MKNDRQIVEIFRERYELTNFFLRKKIPHNQNSSETSDEYQLKYIKSKFTPHCQFCLETINF